MKNKKRNLILIIIVSLIIFVIILGFIYLFYNGIKESVLDSNLPICDDNLIKNCQATKSLTLKNQVYNIGYGNLITLNAKRSITIDCNGATFVGKNTGTIFYSNGASNVNIKNCNFKNVEYPIYFTNSNNMKVNNFYFQDIESVYLENTVSSSITNSIFNGSFESSIILNKFYNKIIIKGNKFLKSTKDAIKKGDSGYLNNNAYIGYNTFKQGGILLQDIQGSIIEYNTWDGAISGSKASSQSSIIIYDGKNNIYRYNNFNNNTNVNYNACAFNTLTNNPTSMCRDIELQRESNSKIYKNTHTNSNNWANTEISGSKNIKIYEDSYNFNDRAIRVVYSSNIEVYKNKISNSVMNFDGYDSAISFEYGDTSSSIHDNEITNYGTYGIFYRKVSGLSIYNNKIDAMTLSDKNKNKVVDGNDYSCAIAGMELIKSWTGDAMESCNNPNVKFISSYKSSNINIYKNSYGSNVQCLFRDQGGINIKNDINNYYYREFTAPTELVDKDKIYFNNNFDKINVKNYIILGDTTKVGQGFCGKWYIVYSHSKNIDYYKNIDKTKTWKISINPINAKKVTQGILTLCNNNCKNIYNLNLKPNEEVFVYY